MNIEIGFFGIEAMVAAEAPKNAGARQSGVFGSQHIDIRIADIQNVLTVDRKRVNSTVGTRFIGFSGQSDARTRNIGEHAFAEAMDSEGLSLSVGFIGHDGELDTGIPQRFDQLGNAVVGMGLFAEVTSSMVFSG